MIKNATTFLSSLNKSEPLFLDILLKREELMPDKNAFTFLSGTDNLTLSYHELSTKIKSLAAFLQQNLEKGDRALLLYPPGFDYIIGYFACLFAGVIAVPVYPPEPNRMEKTLPRLKAIASDSGAKIALSTNEIRNQVVEWRENLKNNNVEEVENTKTSDFLSGLKDILDIKWLATDTIGIEYKDLWNYPQIVSNDIAYLQYTSGSTGTPKGVMITHSNLIHNTNLIFNGFDLGSDEYEGVIWLPIYHDMGLVGGILEPIFAGFHSTLLSPIDFLKRPLKWLQLINDNQDKKIVSGGPNFAYDLCIRASNEQKRKELNLSNWKVAFTGAEPVRAETINEFATAFELSGFKKNAFYPCYGLAEGTLIVSGGNAEKDPVLISISKEELKNNKIVNSDDPKDLVTLVSSGKQILDVDVKIVNPDSKSICKDYEVGEVWSKSNSNAKGYWEKPEISKETFEAFTSDTMEGPFLRTGDLGFTISEDLYITGRLKDLIIIRGSNHYPQDIELTAENSNSLLRPGSVAAFSVDDENEEKLVVVIEARAKQNVDWKLVVEDIKQAVRQGHNIMPSSVVLIQPKTIFKTSSGKIKRNATKEAFLSKSLEIIFEWNNFENSASNSQIRSVENGAVDIVKSNNGTNRSEIEKLLISKLSEELKLNPSEIKTDEPFANYGLDSAKTVQLVGLLEDKINKQLDVTILWTYPTIEKLADYLNNLNTLGNYNSEQSKVKENDKKFEDSVVEMTEEEAEELLMKKLGIK